MAELNPHIGTDKDPEKWSEVHQTVVKAGGYINGLKGYTNWAIGLNVSRMVKSIVGNTNAVHVASTLANVYANKLKFYVFENNNFIKHILHRVFMELIKIAILHYHVP